MFYCRQCNVVYMYLIYRNNDRKLKELNSSLKENKECTYYTFYGNARKKNVKKKLSGRDSLNGRRGIGGILKSLWKNWKDDIKSIAFYYQSNSCIFLFYKPISTWLSSLIDNHLLIEIEYNIVTLRWWRCNGSTKFYRHFV